MIKLTTAHQTQKTHTIIEFRTCYFVVYFL